jgi:hypothetical protein
MFLSKAEVRPLSGTCHEEAFQVPCPCDVTPILIEPPPVHGVGKPPIELFIFTREAKKLVRKLPLIHLIQAGHGSWLAKGVVHTILLLQVRRTILACVLGDMKTPLSGSLLRFRVGLQAWPYEGLPLSSLAELRRGQPKGTRRTSKPVIFQTVGCLVETVLSSGLLDRVLSPPRCAVSHSGDLGTPARHNHRRLAENAL